MAVRASLFTSRRSELKGACIKRKHRFAIKGGRISYVSIGGSARPAVPDGLRCKDIHHTKVSLDTTTTYLRPALCCVLATLANLSSPLMRSFSTRQMHSPSFSTAGVAHVPPCPATPPERNEVPTPERKPVAVNPQINVCSEYP